MIKTCLSRLTKHILSINVVTKKKSMINYIVLIMFFACFFVVPHEKWFLKMLIYPIVMSHLFVFTVDLNLRFLHQCNFFIYKMFTQSVSNRNSHFDFGIFKKTLDYKKIYIVRYSTLIIFWKENKTIKFDTLWKEKWDYLSF